MTAAEKLRKLAVANRWDFRADYSGRAMYGRTCCAIVGPAAAAIIEAAAEVGIKGAVTDSMGRQAVVYWPGIDAPEKDET